MKKMQDSRKPSEKEIREFWEWCGGQWWSIHPLEDYKGGECEWFRGEVLLPDAKGDMPHFVMCDNKARPRNVDLNNLFKYAVPKLRSWDCIIDWAIEMVHAYADGRTLKDPALALFWAIWKVIKGEE